MIDFFPSIRSIRLNAFKIRRIMIDFYDLALCSWLNEQNAAQLFFLLASEDPLFVLFILFDRLSFFPRNTEKANIFIYIPKAPRFWHHNHSMNILLISFSLFVFSIFRMEALFQIFVQYWIFPCGLHIETHTR